jgi:hypothetical protein
MSCLQARAVETIAGLGEFPEACHVLYLHEPKTTERFVRLDGSSGAKSKYSSKGTAFRQVQLRRKLSSENDFALSSGWGADEHSKNSENLLNEC